MGELWNVWTPLDIALHVGRIVSLQAPRRNRMATSFSGREQGQRGSRIESGTVAAGCGSWTAEYLLRGRARGRGEHLVPLLVSRTLQRVAQRDQ